MKTLNETFTEEEHEELKKTKGKRSWHDFILTLIPSPKILEDENL